MSSAFSNFLKSNQHSPSPLRADTPVFSPKTQRPRAKSNDHVEETDPPEIDDFIVDSVNNLDGAINAAKAGGIFNAALKFPQPANFTDSSASLQRPSAPPAPSFLTSSQHGDSEPANKEKYSDNFVPEIFERAILKKNGFVESTFRGAMSGLLDEAIKSVRELVLTSIASEGHSSSSAEELSKDFQKALHKFNSQEQQLEELKSSFAEMNTNLIPIFEQARDIICKHERVLAEANKAEEEILALKAQNETLTAALDLAKKNAASGASAPSAKKKPADTDAVAKAKKQAMLKKLNKM